MRQDPRKYVAAAALAVFAGAALGQQRVQVEVIEEGAQGAPHQRADHGGQDLPVKVETRFRVVGPDGEVREWSNDGSHGGATHQLHDLLIHLHDMDELEGAVRLHLDGEHVRKAMPQIRQLIRSMKDGPHEAMRWVPSLAQDGAGIEIELELESDHPGGGARWFTVPGEGGEFEIEALLERLPGGGGQQDGGPQRLRLRAPGGGPDQNVIIERRGQMRIIGPDGEERVIEIGPGGQPGADGPRQFIFERGETDAIRRFMGGAQGQPGADGQGLPAPASDVWIGVGYSDPSDDLERYFDLAPGSTTLIGNVTDGSPAAEAGLRSMDLLTEINGSSKASPADLIRAVAESDAGDTLTLTVLRKGREREVEVTVARRPGAGGGAEVERIEVLPTPPAPPAPRARGAEAPERRRQMDRADDGGSRMDQMEQRMDRIERLLNRLIDDRQEQREDRMRQRGGGGGSPSSSRTS